MTLPAGTELADETHGNVSSNNSDNSVNITYRAAVLNRAKLGILRSQKCNGLEEDKENIIPQVPLMRMVKRELLEGGNPYITQWFNAYKEKDGLAAEIAKLKNENVTLRSSLQQLRSDYKVLTRQFKLIEGKLDNGSSEELLKGNVSDESEAEVFFTVGGYKRKALMDRRKVVLNKKRTAFSHKKTTSISYPTPNTSFIQESPSTSSTLPIKEN